MCTSDQQIKTINFVGGHPMNISSKFGSNWFQRRRLKCKSLRTTSDGTTSHDLLGQVSLQYIAVSTTCRLWVMLQLISLFEIILNYLVKPLLLVDIDEMNGCYNMTSIIIVTTRYVVEVAVSNQWQLYREHW